MRRVLHPGRQAIMRTTEGMVSGAMWRQYRYSRSAAKMPATQGIHYSINFPITVGFRLPRSLNVLCDPFSQTTPTISDELKCEVETNSGSPFEPQEKDPCALLFG